jgi:hypothetical protein
MLGGYWYRPGRDGRRYCYAKETSWRCPVGSAERLGDVLELAAQEVGIDPAYLLARLRHSASRARVDGKLGDTCAACGHRLERLGFRYWIEAKSDDGIAELERRFGGDGFRQVEGSWYAQTKRDAQAWAAQRARAES